MFFLSTAWTVTAQDLNAIKFDRFTTENLILEKGLSQNSIYCILQDSKGYIWFGTWDGLNKYDGYSFISYKKESGDVKLSYSSVNTIYEDGEGILWIGTSYGLNEYNRQTGEIKYHFHNPENINSLGHNFITSIAGDNNHTIWIGTSVGLNRYDKVKRTFTRIYHDPENLHSLSNDSINKIYSDINGNIWIATENGLNKMNRETVAFIRYIHSSDPTSISDNHITSISQDNKSFLWIGTRNGLNRMDIPAETFRRYCLETAQPDSYNHILSVYADRRGMIWIGTNGYGLCVYDQHHDRYIHYKNNVDDIHSLSNNYVSSLYEDNSGNMWVGTQWRGVNKINRNMQRFSHYQHIPDDPNSLNNNMIWGVYVDSSDVAWIGTNGGGINIINRKTGTYRFLQNIPGNDNSLSDNRVRYILYDPRGYYWIGTFGKGVDRYDEKNNRFRHYVSIPGNDKTISSGIINMMHLDKEGFLWIATRDGLTLLNPETDDITVFRNKPGNSNSLTNNNSMEVFEDSRGYIWIGTYNGLNRYDRKKKTFVTYFNDPANPRSLSNNFIFDILEDKQGNLWIGTMGGGLNKYIRKTNDFIHFIQTDGLPSNVVYCILEDDNEKIWLSTNSGISCFDPDHSVFINYDVKDGIQSSEFNANSSFKNRDGELFFGGMNGFNSFFPKNIERNFSPPQVGITSFRLFHEIQKKECNNGDTLLLTYRDNFFSFEFTAFDYTNPYKNRYAYMLQNYDKEYIYCDADKHFAEYKNVPPGWYIFRVKASNNDGTWNEQGISLYISISPPWWKTMQFLIPFFSFLALLSGWIIYLLFLRVKKKHQVEKRVLEVENKLLEFERKALRLQMNPHFIFNTLNSIQYYILKNDSKSSNKYLSMFSNLMRKTLDNSQYNTIAVRNELETLKLYLDLECLRFEGKFEYTIRCEDEFYFLNLKIPTMIIQPYVENAIRHGLRNKQGKGVLDIILKKDNDSLFCSIRDNGIGREKSEELKKQRAEQHVSMGTRITETRLNLINTLYGSSMKIKYTDLRDEKGNAAGTLVELNIPIMDKKTEDNY